MIKLGTRLLLSHTLGVAMSSSGRRPLSDMTAFHKILQNAKHVVAITGAGVSAESGVPTFRGAGGLWRKYRAQDLATPQAFARDPSLVWEFYHYRRETVLTKQPNNAHKALAEFEKCMKAAGRHVSVVTQNIDELHRSAGSENIIELHGSLFKTRCTGCGTVEENRDSPICPALEGKGAPEPTASKAKVKVEDLPSCKKCGKLIRPHVVWFGENLEPSILDQAYEELGKCDLCIVVGTSSVVYPAAMFAPEVAGRGVPVAEFNLESTPATDHFNFHFAGPCGQTLPEALKLP